MLSRPFGLEGCCWPRDFSRITRCNYLLFHGRTVSGVFEERGENICGDSFPVKISMGRLRQAVEIMLDSCK